MQGENHIIKKAIVEIHVPSAENAMDLQNKALVFFKEQICPMIERIVARYSVPGETIRIDKLELDLEDFNPSSPNDTALRKMEEQIEKKIIQLIAASDSHASTKEIAADQRHSPREIMAAVKKIPADQAETELFLYLLKTGTLPWWAETITPVSLNALAEKMLQLPVEKIRSGLSEAFSHPAVRIRVVYNLPSSTVEKLMLAALPAADLLLRQAEALMSLVRGTSLPSESFRRMLYEFILVSHSFSITSLRQFIAAFIRYRNDLSIAQAMYTRVQGRGLALETSVSNISNLKEPELILLLALCDTDEHFSGRIRQMLIEKDLKILSLAKQDPGAGREKPEEKEKATQIEQENKPVYSLSPVDQPGLLNSPEEFPGDYFIRNSGVIILTPYLPLLFKELGLCEGKDFVSDEARERAVFLLQHLATGQEEGFEEHEMVLAKMLCGMEIQAPLDAGFVISEREKEECDGLLKAVADNWTALKGTTGAGMRDAFFMRDGILEQQSNGWNLKIERTTIDILLEKLPWGISILQMPWSSQMIFVTW